MQNDNERCIKYITNEMDPSEAMVLEKEMMEDEDLLIEVESMRRTLKKLDGMPEYEPPKYLSEKIIQDAVDQQNQRPLQLANIHEASKPTKFFAAAAFVLAGIVFVSMNLEVELGEPAANTSSSSSIKAVQVDGTNKSGSNWQQDNLSWVDRQNVLKFQLFETDKAGAGVDTESMKQETLKKLVPVNNMTNFSNDNSGFNFTNTNITTR